MGTGHRLQARILKSRKHGNQVSLLILLSNLTNYLRRRLSALSLSALHLFAKGAAYMKSTLKPSTLLPNSHADQVTFNYAVTSSYQATFHGEQERATILRFISQLSNHCYTARHFISLPPTNLLCLQVSFFLLLLSSCYSDRLDKCR